MSAGIATVFKKKFGGVEALRRQQPKLVGSDHFFEDVVDGKDAAEVSYTEDRRWSRPTGL